MTLAMNSEFDQLLTSLPRMLDDGSSHDRELAQLLKGLAHRPVPTSKIARLWALGSTQMGVAARSIGAWAKGHSPRARRRSCCSGNEARLRSAMKVLRTMGYLRGAMAKLGQTLATYPSMGPEGLGEILGALNFQAPPMHFSLLRELLINELGDEPENVFSELETQAFAAASLGQVHRGRLKSGAPVAVKIQYPNISRTISADLGLLKGLLTPLRVTKEWNFLADQLEDIKSTIELETDYEREADYTNRARRELADIEDIHVPRVYREFSTKRVLTLELLDGVHMQEFVASAAPQSLHNRHAEQIFRAMCRLFYSGHMVHADPNPGNFLFLRDGSLGLIDFGCCRVFDEGERDYFDQGTRDWLEQGTPSDAVLQRGALLTDQEMQDERRVTTLRAAVDWLWEPLNQAGPFAFDDAYLARGLDCLAEITKKRYTRTTPINTWSNRMFYGVRVLLHRLGASFDAHAVHAEEVRRAGYNSGAAS